MFLHVVSVTYLGDYTLRLEFNDGATKDVNLEGELWGEVFEPLKDEGLFQKVAINPNTGTIEWPNGADLTPEFLYRIGQPVRTDPVTA